MSVLEALVLGLVQGLTEFIPVSSSGHLTVLPFVFGWDEPTLAFDVAVHIGTLAAVLWVFRRTLGELARALTGWSRAPEADRRMIRFLIVGTIPAAVVGVVFRSTVEETFERPVLASLLLGVTGYLLMSTETVYERHQEEERGTRALADPDALLIGIGQAVAILPGISRSGATIAVGMRRGIGRSTAARFSFLLSIPAILGATVVELPDMLDQGFAGGGAAFFVGIVVAGLSGAFAIRWFLGMIERRGLRPFGVWCFLVMVAGLLTGLARG